MVELLTDSLTDDGAERTFQAILEEIKCATSTIEIHMFVWRNDAIGNQIGQAMLEAAERGVQVTIIKDLGAFMYERIEMNRKSFFNKPISLSQQAIYRTLRPAFPDTYCEDDYTDTLGQAVMAHPNVTMRWVNHTHTKYYIFDERVMIVGSINVEERHRGYYDYMVRLEDPEIIARFRARQAGSAPLDTTRTLDFMLNITQPEARFEIKPHFLSMMKQAEKSISIEMAYIGDPDISDAIVEAADRGLEVTMLFSREANIGNDINYRCMHQIYERTSLKVYLTPRMIHSKMLMIDENLVSLGSANFSVFSMQKADELNIIAQGTEGLPAKVRQTFEQRRQASTLVKDTDELANYNHLVASLQQAHQMLNDLFN